MTTAAEWETLTTERHWFLGLSKTMGLPAGVLGDVMTSREYTEYLAAGLIDTARTEVMHDELERARKKR